LLTAGIVKLGFGGNLTMKKLNKNTSSLTGLEGLNPSQTIPANRQTVQKLL